MSGEDRRELVAPRRLRTVAVQVDTNRARLPAGEAIEHAARSPSRNG
jgi:hypothetical protein